MSIVSVRRQGGAAIVTIPAEVMKSLKLDIGAKLEMTADGDMLTARPQTKLERRRYSLRELLAGATPDAMRRLNEATAFAGDGDPVGREL